MRLVFSGASFLIALPALLWSQAHGIVEGTVTNRITHAGIAGVSVRVFELGTRGTMYETTTDPSGAYRVADIPRDGEYRVELFKEGLLPEMGDPFHLSAATGPARVDLTVAALSHVRGKVTGEDGMPVEGAVLQLNSIAGGGGSRATTGKDGTFSFELMPGRMTLRAVPPPKLAPPKSNEPRVWAPTYYPDVSERWRAQAIVLRPGIDEENYDIHLLPVPVFHIRGVVLDDGGKPLGGASIKLVSPDSLDLRSHAPFDEPAAQLSTAADGTFDIAGVRPGEWHLMVSGKRDGRNLSAVVTGAITKSDWDGVQVKLAPPFTVKGVVERSDLRRHTWVALQPAWERRLTGIHDDSGAFEIDDVVAGKYRVQLDDPAAGFYLDTVQYGGRDVLGQTFDVADSSLTMRVVYRSDGGRIQGLAERCGSGMVVAVPAEKRLQTGGFIRWKACGANGQFEVPNLRPGAYTVAAFDRLDDFIIPAVLMGNPELIDAVVAHGETVNVQAGQSTLATLHATRFQ